MIGLGSSRQAVLALVTAVPVLLLPLLLLAGGCDGGEPSGEMVTYRRNFTMPGASPAVPEMYLCTAMKLDTSVEEWVLRFDPIASANRAHHMLLYGCSDVRQTDGYWDCGHHGVCSNGRIMYAWAKNAPSTALPPGVGFRIGGSTGIKYLTLQIHYAVALPQLQDHSGLTLQLTHQQQKYKAGILLMVDGGTVIPGNAEKVHADMVCRAKDADVRADIHVFGHRVHTHSLGVVVTGYRYDTESGEFELIAKGNPQWPQAFYPTQHAIRIRPDDIVAARCTYNASGRARTTYIGSTAKDEMCNLYMMYYTDRERGKEAGVCAGVHYPLVRDSLPEGNDVPLPPNPLLEEKAHGKNTNKGSEVTYKPPTQDNVKPIKVEKKAQQFEKMSPPDDKYKIRPKPVSQSGDRKGKEMQQQRPMGGQESQTDAGASNAKADDSKSKVYEYTVTANLASDLSVEQLGQVTAVAVDSANDVLIFHRGPVVWDRYSFTKEHHLANTSAVITVPAVVRLSGSTGAVLNQWGKDMFFMPHGLTVDNEDNIWLTDVGLHQVFKFPPQFGEGKPILTLGERFVPGSDISHYCKPTAVAVLSNGQFFVADGYCNGRIIKYAKDGSVITHFGKQATLNFMTLLGATAAAPGEFSVPHSLALAEDKGEVCVADRENGRVQCYDTSDSPHHTRIYKIPQWGASLFAVAYSHIGGGRVYCVNGPQSTGNHKVEVYELDFASGKLLSTFSPRNQGLSYPHDMAVTEDGAELYVAEIGPNNLWKFVSDPLLQARPSTASLKKEEAAEATLHINQILKGVGSGINKLIGDRAATGQRWSSMGVSAVILGLLLVPIVVLTSVSLIVRAKRRGKIHLRSSRNGSASTFGHSNVMNGSSWRSDGNGLHQLGSSLLNKHKGFRPLATEDLDDNSSGDSDIEEFSQVATKA